MVKMNVSVVGFGVVAVYLYTRYPIVARAWPLGRVRRASKGILHESSVQAFDEIFLILFNNDFHKGAYSTESTLPKLRALQ